jgi:hypothetical protein
MCGEFADIVRGHERAHVAFLRDALGRKAPNGRRSTSATRRKTTFGID